MVKNQEAKDALESYIKDFNITNFPGENVPSACLRLKAVAKALGNDALPSNVIRKVLDGFAKSSTKAFNEVCSSQIAMRRATFYKDAPDASWDNNPEAYVIEKKTITSKTRMPVKLPGPVSTAMASAQRLWPKQ